MSTFKDEYYRFFFQNIKNEKVFNLNSSIAQQNVMAKIRKQSVNNPFIDEYMIELTEKFLVGRREISKELIDDLVRTAIFHIKGGNYNYIFNSLMKKYLKESS